MWTDSTGCAHSCAQSDSAQPVLRNIYKINALQYKPDNRHTYEVWLNDHLRPGPTGTYNRPQSMSRRSVGRSGTGGRESLQINTVFFSSSPRPLTMVQSRPLSAHQLATNGQRLSLMMQATVRPRSGSGVCVLTGISIPQSPPNMARTSYTHTHTHTNAKRERERERESPAEHDAASCLHSASHAATHTHTHTHTHRPAEHRATSSLHSTSHAA